ncbi:zinc ribbon domain-containing protein [Oscillospiraceae bacterium CM]|nr:zinc ribbon domain-containing protein [Oscillospiraceae bacterium CM]
MAFFEDLGKKVTQTSQDAIKKTKILAETTKINSQISAEKRAISDSFSKIGEKYFELFAENPDENLAVFVLAVKEAQAKINDFEEQINKLKGAESCPSCGASVTEGSLFCTSCGAKLTPPPAEEPVAAPEVKTCSGCGAVLAPGAVFCSGCGQKTE